MPVYRKGKRKVVQQKKIIREKQNGDWWQSKRVLIDDPDWPITRTSLKDIEQRLMFPISNYTRDLCKKKGSPIIIDWGCGEGVAIAEISRKFPKAKCYGFSDISYKSWNKVKKAKFIHDTENDFFTYFKDGSIDFLYSNHGLEHLKKAGIKVSDYFKRLIPKMKIGGIFVCQTEVGSDYFESRNDMANFLGAHKKLVVHFRLNKMNYVYTIQPTLIYGGIIVTRTK